MAKAANTKIESHTSQGQIQVPYDPTMLNRILALSDNQILQFHDQSRRKFDKKQEK